jgi:cell division ATPase FtsA
LNGVDIHISKSSSTFIEAALVGIPTIFTDNLQELRLPTEVIDKGIVLQGGNLDYREIREIAGRDLPDVFEFMNKNELLNQLKRYLNDE